MNLKIVVFSGIDGCGKSTQIQYLARHFENTGQRHKIIWARPGSTPLLIWIKSFVRYLVPSLPPIGRSIKRDQLLKRSVVGRWWLYISLIELLYIYKVKSFFLTTLGYKLIFDRFLIDALIDYKLIFDEKLIPINLIKNIDRFSKSTLKIHLTIPFDESVRRCKIKWEPFPDTLEEKYVREKYYLEIMTNTNYIVLNGLEKPEVLQDIIFELLDKDNVI